jgi:HEPN domain-containing protein
MAYSAAVAGAEDFRAAAAERRRDAAVLHENGRDLAALYMLGYAIECGLKALLTRRGLRFTASGRKGHDLRGLWESAGFKRRDIHGHRRLFLDEWNTALRYRDVLPGHVDAAALYEGGVNLVGYVINRSKRPRPKRMKP